MKQAQIAILASGEGTTAEAFVRAGAAGTIKSRLGLVICNKDGAGIFKRIDQLNQKLRLSIACVLINGKTNPAAIGEIVEPGAQTQAEEAAILELLDAGNFDAIVSMGYLKKIGPRIVQKFGWQSSYSSLFEARLLNTHAGLLPDTKGLWGIHKQEHVIAEHFAKSGQTLHIVAEDYDDGPIVAEHQTTVLPNDTPESLMQRDMEIEKKYLPTDIDKFISDRQKYLQTREVQHGS